MQNQDLKFSDRDDAEVFRAITDNSAVATAIAVGQDLVFRYVNRAYQRLAPGKQMLDRPLRDVWPEVFDQLSPMLYSALDGVRFEAKDLRFDLQRSEDSPPEEGYYTFTYDSFDYGGHAAVIIEAINTTDEVMARRDAERYARSAKRHAREIDRLLERATDGFYALDRDWRFTYLNRRAEEMLQAARQDLIGKVVWDAFPETTATAIYPSYHRAMAEQEVVEFEVYYEPLDLAVQIRAYPDEAGLSVFFLDLGEHKRREAELAGLRRRAEALARYVEDSSQPFAVGTPDQRVAMVNSAFCRLVGFSEEELLTAESGWALVIPESSRPALAGVIGRLNETGEPQRYETEYTRKDGSLVPVDVLSHVDRDVEGRPHSYYSFMTDITERRRADMLREALDEIDTLVHSTLEFDTIMHRSLEAAGRALQADAGSIVMYDGDSTARTRYSFPLGWIEPGTVTTAEEAPFTEYIRSGAGPLVVPDTYADERFVPDINERFGVGAMLATPLTIRDHVRAALALNFTKPRQFAASEVDFVKKLGSSISLALDNAELFEEKAAAYRQLAEKDRAIRQAYSDVIDAATGGRLVLVQPDELDSELGEPLLGETKVESAQQFSAERRRLREVLEDAPNSDDLILAFGEAITNALKHAGPSSYDVRRAEDRLQIVVSDTGDGIDFGRLPKATLMPGFSTKQTLGMGFTLMLELADRLILCTGQEGTTVVIERLV